MTEPRRAELLENRGLNFKGETEALGAAQRQSQAARFAALRANQHPILRLQRTIGNRAVQRLLASLVQPKLTVGAPDDIYEKEADKVAEEVMSSERSSLMQQQTGSAGSDDNRNEDGLREPAPATASPEVRRKCACGGDAEGECAECRMNRLAVQRLSSSEDAGLEAPAIVEHVLASPGQPLADSARRTLEPGFGHDFSQVRVHDDSQAAESASAVSALAYTVGNHIVFGRGQYAPGTTDGNRLLAHELTHVVQQGGAPAGLLTTESAQKPNLEIRGQARRSAIQRDSDSDDYKQGYQDGLNGAESNAGPRDGDALTDYGEGYAKGHYEFSQQSSGGTPGPNPSQGSPPASGSGDSSARLDEQYRGWLAEQNWTEAAESLNGFNSDDIKKRLQETPDLIASIHQGALDNPRLGPQSQVALLTLDASAASTAAKPDPEYVQKVLDGTEALVKLSEAVAIVAHFEELLEVIEPIGGVLSVVTMVLGVWRALELPERTCGYQGLCYGLMYSTLGMGDPQPNPGWPGAESAPSGAERFQEGVSDAKARLAEGREGVERKNLLLLAIAKHDAKTVINDLWQHAISDDDHLLRMYTIEWPNVGPNG